MLVKAEQKFLRISPRKVRLVSGVIKDLSPLQALVKLKFIRKKSAQFLYKVIKQAIANAVNIKKMKEEDLRFKSILVTPAASLKRWRARAKGKTDRINKRTCHIKVVLGD